MEKVVPLPGRLSTKMWPPLWLTMPNTVARPRPVPLPKSLVVKNGSKMCASGGRVHAAAGVLDGEQHVRAGDHFGMRAAKASST